METYPANQPLRISVLLTTPNSDVVTDAAGATYRVLGSLGQELFPSEPLALTAGVSMVEIEVDAAKNTLLPGEIRSYRQIEVSFTSGGKLFVSFEEYLIEARDALIPNVNSFQTYAEAMVAASEITGIQTLYDATRREQSNALINSYRILSRMLYNVRGTRISFPMISLDAFQALPVSFADAIKMAQIIEAAEALDEFSILKKRQQGLMSESIGESSMMFRPEKVLNIPVTRRSMDILRPYLDWEIGIGRG